MTLLLPAVHFIQVLNLYGIHVSLTVYLLQRNSISIKFYDSMTNYVRKETKHSKYCPVANKRDLDYDYDHVHPLVKAV